MTKEYFRRHCEMSVNLNGKGPKNSLWLRELREDFDWWDVIVEFSQLERLTLYGGGITALDTSLSKLKDLKYLGVRYSPIASIPEFLLHLPKLEVIYFQSTCISQLPSFLFEHPSVLELHLESNKIINLPRLDKLNFQLEKISLLCNPINSVPERFLKMLPGLKEVKI